MRGAEHIEGREPCLISKARDKLRSASTEWVQAGRQELCHSRPLCEGDRQVEICRRLSRRRHAVLQAAAQPACRTRRVKHIDAERGARHAWRARRFLPRTIFRPRPIRSPITARSSKPASGANAVSPWSRSIRANRSRGSRSGRTHCRGSHRKNPNRFRAPSFRHRSAGNAAARQPESAHRRQRLGAPSAAEVRRCPRSPSSSGPTRTSPIARRPSADGQDARPMVVRRSGMRASRMPRWFSTKPLSPRTPAIRRWKPAAPWLIGRTASCTSTPARRAPRKLCRLLPDG